MKLEGIHHVTAITGDAPGNVEFYTGVLGLHLVKKSVNQDDPTVYHLFYGDQEGSPGADLTFFEYPHAARGSAGAGMVHRIVWRVASSEALKFWSERLGGHDSSVRSGDGHLVFADPEGLMHELVVSVADDEPLTASAPGIPSEYALQGFDGVRAYASDPGRSEQLLAGTLGFTESEGQMGERSRSWQVRGERRGSFYDYDSPPAGVDPFQGAGTVHHVAFAAQPEDEESWRMRLLQAGVQPTPVIDRFYFRSVYFREPSGVLFEIATIGPGFAVDEDADHLGERLSLPPRFESLRGQLEATLTPLPSTTPAGVEHGGS
jgi:glyoxalase family protein